MREVERSRSRAALVVVVIDGDSRVLFQMLDVVCILSPSLLAHPLVAIEDGDIRMLFPTQYETALSRMPRRVFPGASLKA